MDQLIFASLSHTHYWYEEGTLKVPVVDVLANLLEVAVDLGRKNKTVSLVEDRTARRRKHI